MFVGLVTEVTETEDSERETELSVEENIAEEEVGKGLVSAGPGQGATHCIVQLLLQA